MSILEGGNLGDIAWTATRQEGVPLLALQAEEPRSSLVFSRILVENLHVRRTSSDEFILVEGFGRPNVLLESSIHPLTDQVPGSVESAVEAVLTADWNGDPWKLIMQYTTPQGDQRSRAWLTQGKTGVRTLLLPGIGNRPDNITLFWPVRIFG